MHAVCGAIDAFVVVMRAGVNGDGVNVDSVNIDSVMNPIRTGTRVAETGPR